MFFIPVNLVQAFVSGQCEICQINDLFTTENISYFQIAYIFICFNAKKGVTNMGHGVCKEPLRDERV